VKKKKKTGQKKKRKEKINHAITQSTTIKLQLGAASLAGAHRANTTLIPDGNSRCRTRGRSEP
jgi:hypothetical protein